MFKIFFRDWSTFAVAPNRGQPGLTNELSFSTRTAVLVPAARGGGVCLLVYRYKENQPDCWVLWNAAGTVFKFKVELKQNLNA